MDFKKEMESVQDIVESILREDERSRNDDKWLIYKVLRRFSPVFIPFEDFNKLPSFETITRCRRVVQNDMKMFLPTDERVLSKRFKRNFEFRDWAKSRGLK